MWLIGADVVPEVAGNKNCWATPDPEHLETKLITAEDVGRLETAIDLCDAQLRPLKAFILLRLGKRLDRTARFESEPTERRSHRSGCRRRNCGARSIQLFALREAQHSANSSTAPSFDAQVAFGVLRICVAARADRESQAVFNGAAVMTPRKVSSLTAAP